MAAGSEPDNVELALPDTSSLAARIDQDEEWCEVRIDGRLREIRFHDYHEIYAIPGLYEKLFYDELECASPSEVRALLEEELVRAGTDPATLRVLDVGAGNGMVGEELARLDVEAMVGIDIIEEAAHAAQRDRPGLYADYLVADLTELDPQQRDRLSEARLNAMTTVAALGFGDIPPRAFACAFDFVADGGWIAFNIKEQFLGKGDDTGFSRLIKRMVEGGALELRGQRRYRHRLSMLGEPLFYVAMVAVKRGEVDFAWVREIEDAG